MQKERKMRSLTTTLALVLFSLSTIALLISGVAQLTTYYQIQQEIIASKQKYLASYLAEQIISFMQNKFVTMDVTGISLDIAGESRVKLEQVLKGLLGLQRTIRHVAIMDKSGKIVTGSSRYSEKMYNNFVSIIPNNIMAQLSRDNHYISKVYIDDLTKEPMAILASAEKSAPGDLKYAIICEVTLMFMWGVLDTLEVGKTGYAYVVDRAGDMIASKDPGRVLKGEKLSGIKAMNDFLTGSHSDIDNLEIYKGIMGTDVIGRHIPLKMPDWAVITELPTTEAFQDVWKSAVTTAIIILLMALISGFVGLMLARRLSSPLVTLCSKFKIMSEGEGDLTFQLTVKTKNEIGELAEYFNKFIRKLSLLINKTKNVSTENKQLGDSLAAHTEEVSATITEISATMKSMNQKIEHLDKELKKAADAVKQVGSFINKAVTMISDQSSSVEQSSSAIQEMIANINNLAKITGTKKELTLELATLAEDGNTSLTNTVNSISEITKSAEIMFDMIKIINGVARETNLLAMNAAIEAAHAGDSGKGFSVIAQEIRNLAETTAKNTKEMSKSLKSIITKIKDTETVSDKANIIISKLISGIKQLTDTMSEILNGLSEVNIGSEQITLSLSNLISITEDVKNSSNDLDINYSNINQAIDVVYKLTDDTKNSISEISASVTEISQSIYNLTDLTNKNINNLLTLDESMAKFKTE